MSYLGCRTLDEQIAGLNPAVSDSVCLVAIMEQPPRKQWQYHYTERKKKRIFTLSKYLYQRYIVCVNESVFEMLNIHIWTHCDTFHYKQTMCVLRVNGKSARGNASETTFVCNNRKNWFFKCHSFWQFGMNWKASVTIIADFSPEFDPPVRWRSKHQTKNDC